MRGRPVGALLPKRGLESLLNGRLGRSNELPLLSESGRWERGLKLLPNSRVLLSRSPNERGADVSLRLSNGREGDASFRLSKGRGEDDPSFLLPNGRGVDASLRLPNERGPDVSLRLPNERGADVSLRLPKEFDSERGRPNERGEESCPESERGRPNERDGESCPVSERGRPNGRGEESCSLSERKGGRAGLSCRSPNDLNPGLALLPNERPADGRSEERSESDLNGGRGGRSWRRSKESPESFLLFAPKGRFDEKELRSSLEKRLSFGLNSLEPKERLS